MDWPAFIPSFLFNGLWQGLCRELFLMAELALVAGMLAGFVGKDNGVRLLFWHEDPKKQFLAGLATALFTSTVLLVGFLLHENQATVWARYLPAEMQDNAKWHTAWFVAGGWAVIILFAMAMAAVNLLRRALASSNVDRTQANGYAPFVAGCGLGLVLTPVLGAALFWLADALHLADYVTAPTLRAEQRQVHGLAAALTLLMTAAYLVIAFQKWSWLSTPAMGFCLSLSLIAAIYGFCKFQTGHPAPFIPPALAHPLCVVAVLSLLFLVGGLPRYKFRFRDLDKYYIRLKRHQVAPAEGRSISTEQRIVGPMSKDGTSFEPRPMVLVCASGGGLRAAVWTAAVLCELEEKLAGFPYYVSLVSGASGGMVGAGYYVASLQPPGGKARHSSVLDAKARRSAGFGPRTAKDAASTSRALLDSLADDMLSSVFKGMLFRDLLRFFLPFRVRHDRGELLENTWRLNMGSAWEQSFADLREGEQAGWRPSLVYSPMLVEDGRRVLISNLDLENLTTSHGNYVTGDPFYSQSAFEFFQLFPAASSQLRISAAARMSASFPYFSPATVLPTNPRRRVVDAGYFDNYGVTIAANWLEEILNSPANCELLRKHVSGVAIVEIRDGLSNRGNRPNGVGDRKPNTPLTRGAEELSSPIEGLFAARDSVALYRNDEKLDWLCNRFRDARFDDQFFTNVLFQFSGSVPLSWYLTKMEKNELITAASHACAGPDGEAFRRWWTAKSQRATVTV
jgi:hypothetical protein